MQSCEGSRMKSSVSHRSKTVQFDGKSYWEPPWVSLSRRGGNYQYVIMQLHLGWCEVNGKRLSKKVTITHQEPKIAMETFLVVR